MDFNQEGRIFLEQQQNQIPEIEETEEEKGLSVKNLKRKILNEARRCFVRTPHVAILNKDKNWPIELSSRVIKEWRAKSRTRERIIAIKALDIMLEGAKFLNTVDDVKDTQGIENVSYFENFCKINGLHYGVNSCFPPSPGTCLWLWQKSSR
jgi:hypothetical protein